MKKYLAIFTLFTCLGFGAQAQLRFGIEGSPTFNWTPTSTDDIESNLQLKFNYGLLLEYAFAENYLISSGVYHSFDGGQIEFSDATDTTSGVYTLNLKPEYVEVPILLKMRTKEIGYMTYFARIGLSAGFRISDDFAFADDAIDEEDVFPDASEPMSALFKTAMKIGLGAEYNLGGSTSIILGATLTNNFNDMVNRKPALDNDNETIKYKNLAINVAVIF